MKTKRKGRTVNADLGAYKDSCLDPLVFFAPPVLEPDSNDPGVQPRHLHQLLLAQEIAGQHGDGNVRAIMCLIIPSALMSQTQSILTTIDSEWGSLAKNGNHPCLLRPSIPVSALGIIAMMSCNLEQSVWFGIVLKASGQDGALFLSEDGAAPVGPTLATALTQGTPTTTPGNFITNAYFLGFSQSLELDVVFIFIVVYCAGLLK